jgi:hypothetical protein
VHALAQVLVHPAAQIGARPGTGALVLVGAWETVWLQRDPRAPPSAGSLKDPANTSRGGDEPGAV